MTKIENILGEIYDALRGQDIERFGTYLPEDFSHMVYVPKEIHPLGGLCQGKAAALQRFAIVAQEYDLLRYDTSDPMVQRIAPVCKSTRTTATGAPASRSRLPSQVFGPSRTPGRSN
jgi:hypothetical protein